MTPRVRVIGCGNVEAGDDALGLLAVRAARSRLESIGGIEIVETGSAHRVADYLQGVGAAVVVDAVRTPGGSRPAGELVRFQVGPGGGLPAEIGGALSSHGFGLAEAVGIAAALEGLPRLVFLGLEAGNSEAGAPLTFEVASAIPALAVLIESEVVRLIDERVP